MIRTSEGPSRPRFWGSLVLAAVLAVGSVGGISAQTTVSDVPLKRVVLYFAGLAYYEHSGTVSGDAIIRLNFKTGQMNDVLKTLVLRDLGGGTIQAVTYAAQEPAQRSLRSFAIDLSGQPALAGILRQVIGQELRLSAPDSLVGRLISLETRPRVAGMGNVGGSSAPILVDDTWLNLWTAQGIKSVALSQLANIELTDKRLQDELIAALNLLKTSSDDERRSIDIVCKGSGNREIRFGYIQEAPVWKTSYRLDLSGTKPYLQGWALVENTTEADWKGVQLSLAGGQPIAFIQDLYTPLYVQRPVVGIQQTAQLGPQTYSQGQVATGTISPGAPAAAPVVRGQTADKRVADGDFYRSDNQPISSTSVQSAAVVGKEGETFFFGIRDPLSLARHQSAMIPIITNDIEGDPVSIFNASVNAKRALLGVWLKGLAGLRLPAGPLAVFAGGLYAGDSLLDTLGEKERRLLSYGVDLDLQVQVTNANDRLSTTYSVVKGVIITRTAWKYSTKYALQNNGAKERRVLIEHPYNSARNLTAGQKFEEKTDDRYRFMQVLGPGEQRVFTVAEEQTLSESAALINLRSSGFATWTNGQISPAMKTALTKAADLKLIQERFQDRLTEIQKRQTEIAQDQARIRANIETVGRDSTQGKRYLQKLSEEETELDGLAKETETAKTGVAKGQKDFEDYIRSLTID